MLEVEPLDVERLGGVVGGAWPDGVYGLVVAFDLAAPFGGGQGDVVQVGDGVLLDVEDPGGVQAFYGFAADQVEGHEEMLELLADLAGSVGVEMLECLVQVGGDVVGEADGLAALDRIGG
jgi:hypothetical protein